MQRLALSLLFLASSLLISVQVAAGQRVPESTWMQYPDAARAGFDATKLAAAHDTWEGLPSASFLVIANGAIVADWGDSQRRFMCHSVRKSFLAALYGIYWDRGEIKLNKTLADLGIDDEPDPLLETEKQARILDLLKARSGIFHPAAYAGRTDSQPRGSQGPGRYFAYNNWDFNTLATILMQETGDDVFESFDKHFAEPLQMQDWRVSDGYYHLEPDKSRYPAYPFRMSGRDAARIGLLFARDGKWGDQQILSKHWVRRCTAQYSIDNEVRAYGFMWWVYREPRFAKYGMVAALGVGNQMIAVLPEIDMVIVNRANTYERERTPEEGLLNLIEQVLAARVGEPLDDPGMVMAPQTDIVDTRRTRLPSSQLAEFVGEWSYPPMSLQLPARTSVKIHVDEGHLVSYVPQNGTFRLYLQEDGSFLEEDTHRRYSATRNKQGAVDGFADAEVIVTAAVNALAAGDRQLAEERMRLVEKTPGTPAAVGKAIFHLADGSAGKAEQQLRELLETANARDVEAMVNVAGYGFLQANQLQRAREVFALNAALFPEAANTWDSLGEAHMLLGNDAKAIECYEKSLSFNPNNGNATSMIERIRQGSAERE